MIKKLIIIMFVCSFITIGFRATKAKGITNTGHDDIKELDFKDTNSGYLLLNQMSGYQISRDLKKVDKCAFGWSVYVINDELPIWYISDIIFSRSNYSNQPLKIDYDVKYTKTAELEISASGSISGKLSGKIKGASLSIEATIKGEITKNIKNYYEEKTSFEYVINPYKKMSLIVKGDASLSTGVGKYYFLGIPLKKGTWEYINVETEYYELVEEEL